MLNSRVGQNLGRQLYNLVIPSVSTRIGIYSSNYLQIRKCVKTTVFSVSSSSKTNTASAMV